MRILLAILLTALVGATGLAQQKRAGQMPKIQTIGNGVVWRVSDNKDQHGNDLPPWKEVQITNIFGFKQAPTIGSRVTVVPIDVNAALIDLAIIKTTPRTDCEMSGPPTWWEVELEPVKQKEYFEITKAGRREEVPFDVVIFYPTVKVARQLQRNELRKNSLPKGVYVNTVKAAIDLANDGIPDVVITAYCCLHPAKADDECDHTCGKIFQRIGNRWRLVNTSNPC